MEVFIDLGAFDGDTIEIALKKYKKLDRIFAFEPYRENFEKMIKKFDGRKNIFLVNAAADVKNSEEKLYLGRECGSLGGSLCENKTTCFNDQFEKVKTIDFSKYVKENFRLNDRIILKIDVEGKEYEILEKMVKDGSITYIDEIFCEWHYDRIDVDYENHIKCVKQLRRLGFNLTGSNNFDEFICVWMKNNIKLQVQRHMAYAILRLKYFLMKKHPKLYHRLKIAFRKLSSYRSPKLGGKSEIALSSEHE